jgi:urease accessory protein
VQQRRLNLPLQTGLLVARYRGACSQSARAWFVHLWSLVRPAMTGRAAQPPRIWAT